MQRKLKLTWQKRDDGHPPRVGMLFHCGPRARVGYEICTIRDVKSKHAGPDETVYALTVEKYPVSEILERIREGASSFEFRWHPRSKRR